VPIAMREMAAWPGCGWSGSLVSARNSTHVSQNCHLALIATEGGSMAGTAELDAMPATIEASVNYLLDNGTTPSNYSGGPGSTEVRSTGTPDPHNVVMHNGREKDFTLAREGFHFTPHDTRVTDFMDPDEIRGIYYPEMEALVKAESGASRVVVFDHTIRTADDAFREQHKIREVVQRVHNDYTEWSGPQRVREILPDEAEALMRRRFAIIQVWRPIRHPVETYPLAICDARSVKFDDFVIAERRYPNRVGQTYSVKYNPNHVWYWFPRMRRIEALVFKVYDSLKDGTARWTAHSAFNLPHAPPDAPPRESIEIRTMAFF
jgi:hypothetical protein